MGVGSDNAPQLGAPIYGTAGLAIDNFQASFDATPPPTASDAAYVPDAAPLEGTIAGNPSSLVAHGVSINDLGAFPGGAKASNATPDLYGVDIVNPARAADGFHLRGAGTPELMQGQPPMAPLTDYLGKGGIVHVGIPGLPGIPVAVLAILGLAAAYVLWSTRGK